MKGKIALVVGAGAGYVLGTRAGRERYEQIKSSAQRFWQDPRVRETATRAQQKAQEQAPRMQETAVRAAGSVREATSGRAGDG